MPWKEISKSLKKNNCIIALGGGAFINDTIRENILKNAISIWLDIDIKTLDKRIKLNKKRPLLKNNDNETILRELYDKRRKIYKLANHKVNCDKLNKEDLARKIIKLYEKY